MLHVDATEAIHYDNTLLLFPAGALSTRRLTNFDRHGRPPSHIKTPIPRDLGHRWCYLESAKSV